MKLRNKQAGMEIGIVHISKSDDFKKGYWLYVQVGGGRMMVTRIEQDKGKKFIRLLHEWDKAGGNDGGIER